MEEARHSSRARHLGISHNAHERNPQPFFLSLDGTRQTQSVIEREVARVTHTLLKAFSVALPTGHFDRDCDRAGDCVRYCGGDHC
eukprot:scaffold63777_cov45-Phaeocystis_antarctica.AAC.2